MLHFSVLFSLPHLLSFSALLCEILTVVLALVAGLDVILFGLVAVLVVDIKHILACLKIDELLGLCALLKIVL